EACLAFGAGFMLAVALLGVIPQVLDGSPAAALYILFGYLAVHLAQHVFTPHFHFGEETHRVSPSAGISAVLGLTLHTFFDGLAISAGVTLYVAASNLVPEFQAKRGWLSALAFFGGAAGFFLAERLLEVWVQ